MTHSTWLFFAGFNNLQFNFAQVSISIHWRGLSHITQSVYARRDPRHESASFCLLNPHGNRRQYPWRQKRAMSRRGQSHWAEKKGHHDRQKPTWRQVRGNRRQLKGGAGHTRGQTPTKRLGLYEGGGLRAGGVRRTAAAVSLHFCSLSFLYCSDRLLLSALLFSHHDHLVRLSKAAPSQLRVTLLSFLFLKKENIKSCLWIIKYVFKLVLWFWLMQI